VFFQLQEGRGVTRGDQKTAPFVIYADLLLCANPEQSKDDIIAAFFDKATVQAKEFRKLYTKMRNLLDA
jgi:hypothetical protein